MRCLAAVSGLWYPSDMAKSTDNRTENLVVRISPAERAKLEKMAAAAQRSLSDWVRLTLLSAKR